MATDDIRTIGSGGTYSLPQLWEDDKPANLVTADKRWIGEAVAGSNFSTGANLLSIGGSTTDATRYAWLRAQSGASFADNPAVIVNPYRYNEAAGVSMSAGDNYSEGVVVTDQFTRISRFQIKGNGTRAALQCLAVNCTFEDLIVVGAQPFFSSNSGLTLSNCLFVKTTSGGAIVTLQSNFNVYNCGFIVPSDVGTVPSGLAIVYTSGASTITNCYVLGPTTAAPSDGNVTYTDCLTSQATPTTGFTTTTFNTSLVVNTTNTNGDYKPVSGSALIDFGDTSAQAPVDVKGTTRAVAGLCDVGPWEFVTASGGGAGSLSGSAIIKSLFGGLVQ